MNRSCVRVRWRAPDDLGQALTAFNRALRAHRRLAKLAPRLFDQAVIDREAENRAERRRWMAMWQPIIARVYGTEPAKPDYNDVKPPLPPPRTQRAADFHLAAWKMWMEIGRTAMERHERRHPHALVSLCCVARLLGLAFAFKDLALGLNSPNPLPEKIAYDYTFADIKRSYPSPPGDSTPADGVVATAAAPAVPVPATQPPAPAGAPPVAKRDLTPVKLVTGPHGFLTYEYPKPDSG